VSTIVLAALFSRFLAIVERITSSTRPPFANWFYHANNLLLLIRSFLEVSFLGECWTTALRTERRFVSLLPVPLTVNTTNSDKPGFEYVWGPLFLRVSVRRCHDNLQISIHIRLAMPKPIKNPASTLGSNNDLVLLCIVFLLMLLASDIRHWTGTDEDAATLGRVKAHQSHLENHFILSSPCRSSSRYRSYPLYNTHLESQNIR